MIKFPESLEKMKPEQRWQWFDRQKELLRKAAKDGVEAKLSSDLSECFMFMLDLSELKHCQMIALHNNAVVVAACALIEKNDDESRDWLLNLLEQADDPTWQMYEKAKDYFDKHYLPCPESIQEHRENIAKQDQVFTEDNERFAIWYEENLLQLLVKGGEK